MSSYTKKHFVIAAFILILGMAIGSCANAACMARELMQDGLKERYNEDVVSRGIDSAGRMLEVYASPEGGFTVVQTTPDGRSCAVASGTAWANVPLEGEGA